MGITHAELFRQLPEALGCRRHTVAPGRITVVDGQAVVRIGVSEQGERRLGALVLPMTYLEFDFQGCTAAQVQAFIERFDRCYRRGGG